MNDIFRLRVTARAVWSQYRLNLDCPKVNQLSFGNNSIRSCEKFGVLSRLTKGPTKVWKHSKGLQKSKIALLVTAEYAKPSHLKCCLKNLQKFS